jgi:hypothetical protein
MEASINFSYTVYYQFKLIEMGCIPSKTKQNQANGSNSYDPRAGKAHSSSGQKPTAEPQHDFAPWVSGHSKLVVEKTPDGEVKVKIIPPDDFCESPSDICAWFRTERVLLLPVP